jgi:hypothetical protein
MPLAVEIKDRSYGVSDSVLPMIGDNREKKFCTFRFVTQSLKMNIASKHFTITFLLFMPLSLLAQENLPLTIKKTANFDISGSGSAAEWNKTDWVTLAKRKGVADYNTRAKLLYSETGIYCLFSCQDKKITATMKEDFANLWTEDVVEIFLWPDETTSIYFEYELSPLNYELPILVPNMEGNFLGWRPWQYEGDRKTRHATKVLKEQDGNTTEWIGEVFIPYALLKPLRNVPPEKGTRWRMNMYRVDYDKEYTSWSWQQVQKNFHDYENFGVIVFE